MKNTIITLASVVALAGTANAQTITSITASPEMGALTAGSLAELQDGITIGANGMAWNTPAPSGTLTFAFDSLYDFSNVLIFDDYNVTGSYDGLEDFSISIDGNPASNFVSTALPSTSGENFGLSGVGRSIVLTLGPTEQGFTQFQEIKFTGTVVPEPSSTALLGLGALGLLVRRKR